MLLSFAEINKEYEILKINGKENIKKHLEDMGFIVGTKIKIVSISNGNSIINIRNSKIGLGKDLTSKIIVTN